MYMCVGRFRGHKSSNRIEFVQNLLKFFWFGFPQFWGMGQVGGRYLGWPAIIYMSSAVFRGKESSNRIELSWLVQDLLSFGVLGSLQLLGRGRWVGGIWGMKGCPNTCTHAFAFVHIYTHMYTCIEIANGCPHGDIHVYHVYNMHVHACMCVCIYLCMCL